MRNSSAKGTPRAGLTKEHVIDHVMDVVFRNAIDFEKNKAKIKIVLSEMMFLEGREKSS